MSAGYSGTPLVKKLGIKAGAKLYINGAPPHYFDLLGSLPEDVRISPRLSGEFDFIHIFAQQRARLTAQLAKVIPHLQPDGMVWISWPKGTSKLETDLNGGLVRELGQAAGLVDIKVCAVDDDWSGHKFVIPVADRPKSKSKSKTAKRKTAKSKQTKPPAQKKSKTAKRPARK